VVSSSRADSSERSRAFLGLLRIGKGALAASRLDVAQRVYSLVLAEAPEGTAHRFHALAGLGALAEVRNDTEGARRAYAEIVEDAKDSELVRWARERLGTLDPGKKAEGEEPPLDSRPTRIPRQAKP
jgi:hypothetical protein